MRIILDDQTLKPNMETIHGYYKDNDFWINSMDQINIFCVLLKKNKCKSGI